VTKKKKRKETQTWNPNHWTTNTWCFFQTFFNYFNEYSFCTK